MEKVRRVVDLFCGIGGLTHGFVREGFEISCGIDSDESCRYAYEANNPMASFKQRDVSEVMEDHWHSLFPDGCDVRILVGCAPCQPFSNYTNFVDKESEAKDRRWNLLTVFGEAVETLLPEIVSMENVPQLVKHPVFDVFHDTLKCNGYHVWWKIIECADYGVPQTRKRLVLMASRYAPISLEPATHSREYRVKVEDAIGGLPPIEAGKADPNDALHRASTLSEINLNRLRHSKPGGTWRDWPEELRLECHRKSSGESYKSVYGRMKWDELSPTITTQCNGIGNGRFGHPDQLRAISLREAALLQTFPVGYRFVKPDKPFNFTNLARHIGNAVPVALAAAIARSIRTHLEVHDAR